jgi:hypothetical protein
VPICEIKINPGRRKIEAKDVQDLAKSISQVGLLNPITVRPDHTLIAGNGWLCTIRMNRLLVGNYLKTHKKPEN